MSLTAEQIDLCIEWLARVRDDPDEIAYPPSGLVFEGGLADTLEAYADVVQKVAETPAHAYGQDEDREYVYLKLPKATHDRSRELRGLPMTNGATPDSGALDDALTRIAYETQFGVPMPKMEKQWPTSDGQLGDQ